MARFSIGTAIGAGFGLIRRRPLAIFVWGIVMIAPIVILYGLVAPTMIAAFSTIPEGADPEAFKSALIGPILQFQAVSALVQLVQLLGIVVVYTAIFRAVIRPKETRWFSMRLGMDEVRVAVVGLAIAVGLYASLIVILLLGFGIGFGAYSAGGERAAIGTAIVLGLAFLIAIFWASARVSLIAPMSVLDRDFAFARGWKLGRGQAWPLVGMMVLLWLIMMAIYMVVAAIGLAIFAAIATMNGLADMAASGAFETDASGAITQLITRNWPWLGLGGLFLCAVYWVFMTLSMAPFASAALQLSGGAAAPEQPEPTVDYQGPLS